MAELDSTLRTRFAQSKFVVKTNFIKSPVFLHDTSSGMNVPIDEPIEESANGFNIAPLPVLTISSLSHDNFPTTMETLRSHVNYLLTLPLPVAVKNRLWMKYWAVQRRLEAVGLLLDAAQEDETLLGEEGIDSSCLDLSELDFSGLDLTGLDLSGFYLSGLDSSGLGLSELD